MKTNRYEPVLLNDSALREEIGRLRVAVYRAAGYFTQTSFTQSTWFDDHDEHAMHWAIIEKGVLVAASRMCIHEKLLEIPDFHLFPEGRRIRNKTDFPFAAINRLVVAKDYQGQGIARMMDDVRIKKARELGARSIIVRPRVKRYDTLVRRGFIELGQAKQDLKTPMIQDDKFMLLPLEEGGPSPLPQHGANDSEMDDPV